MSLEPPQTWTRGTLFGGAIPSMGENFVTLHQGSGVRIEEITSSRHPDPKTYRQDHDEWVVLLRGGAELDVAGETIALGPGQWLLLPAGVEHRVESTLQGSVWLAMHMDPSSEAGTGEAPSSSPHDAEDQRANR